MKSNARIYEQKTKNHVKHMYRHVAMPQCTFQMNNTFYKKQSICLQLVNWWTHGAAEITNKHDFSSVFKANLVNKSQNKVLLDSSCKLDAN